MPGARLGGIRPEKKMQLIAAASLITSRCEHGKQRKPAVLVAVLAEESVVLRTSERERPERPKTKATRRRLRVRGHVIHPAKVGRIEEDGKKIPTCPSLTQKLSRRQF